MTQESSPHSASAPSTFSSPSLSTATTESVGGRRRSRDLMIDEDTPMSSSASAPSLPPANSSLSPHHSSEQQHQQPSMVRRSSGSSYSKRESFVRTPEDSFRDEIVRQIFGENLGCIRDDASCAVESKILLHGRIYITDKFVCFYSNFFGFEKKIKIPFSQVRTLSKGNTALLIPNCIIIQTHGKEYCFRSFWDRDECFWQMARCFRAYHRMQSVPREAVMECRSLDRTGRIENSTATVVEDGGGPMAGTGRPQTASSMSASYSQQQPQQFRRQQSGHRKGPQKQEEHREAGAEDRRGSHPPLPPEPRSQGPSQQPSVSTHGEGGTGPPYGISGEPVGGEFLPARAPSDETGGFPQHPDTPGPGPTLAAPSSPDLSLPPPLDVHPVDAYEEAGEGERRDVSRGATSPSPLAPGGGSRWVPARTTACGIWTS
ncbi:gram domain-containing protein 1a [Nannochloropsis gaditana]|uniref:Gram domain-containing protein 1a n=1 Tax=Nannochloropsis gaditana TaxID=72520 RepID=W7TDU9_9STRA|nr:gram domain-containing protein 1a [Nannochloropsis gaditana]